MIPVGMSKPDRNYANSLANVKPLLSGRYSHPSKDEVNPLKMKLAGSSERMPHMAENMWQ